MGDNWAPWLGLGLDLSRSDYSKRHTVDSDGFLLERFSDRDETGLGLVICRQIVEGHGGRLEAHNNDEGGATFTMILPDQPRDA